MCPGDDDKASWKNQEFVGCDKDNDKDNKKSSISSDCNYNGLNVCDSSGKCDDENFDCISDCPDPKANDITGNCPGDDKL
jgi:hypothetical protein